MKNLNVSNLSTQYGSEPIIVVTILWAPIGGVNQFTDIPLQSGGYIINVTNTSEGQLSYYSDKAIGTSYPAKILEISEITFDVDFSGNSNTSTVTVTLDDSDGAILNILSTSSIHLRPAAVYVYINENLTLLFEGQIVSDFRWSDKNRQVVFNFLSYVQAKEVGFSPEQGWVEDLPLEMIGRNWPFGFGDVVKYPCLRINYTPTCVLTEPIGIMDGSLNVEIARLMAVKAYMVGIAQFYALAALEALFSGYPDIGQQMTDLMNQALVYVQEVITQTANLQDILEEQVLYAHGLVFGPGGVSGGQGKVQVLTDVPLKLSGLFSCGDLVLHGSLTPLPGRVGLLEIDGVTHPIPGSKTWGDNYFPPDKDPFTFEDAGTNITFLGAYACRYLVNALPSNVQGVYAYRLFGGFRRLTPVPSIYYNIISVTPSPESAVTSYPIFPATIVETTQPLSTLRNQGWEDDLYVSYSSSVGPNFQDIMNFLISNYTIFSANPNTLASIPVFQCSFVLQEQKDVMQVIKEICYQCNTAVWLYQNVFYFNYMPDFNGTSMNVSLSNILQDSVEISISPTENIVTNMKGAWQPNYQYDIKNYVVIRYNDNIYGTFPLETDFYCFQDPTSVRTAMANWIYRKGNIWKRIKISVPMPYIQLDIFDNVLLGADVVNLYQLGPVGTLSDGSIGGVGGAIAASVIGMSFNPTNWTVGLELELPVYVGSGTPSPAYWTNQAGGTPLYAIDSDYQLTETAQQTAFYQRGFAIDQQTFGAQLQAAFLTALTPQGGGGGGGINISSGSTSDGLPAPNELDGSPAQAGVDKWSVTDTGGPLGTYISSGVQFPSLSNVEITPQGAPSWQYTYGNYPVNISPPYSPVVMPGTIDSGNGDGTYSCTVYPSGPNSSSGMQVQGTPLQLNSNDTVPGNTWAIFIRIPQTQADQIAAFNNISNISTINTNSSSDLYYFSVPVWLGGSNGSGNGGGGPLTTNVGGVSVGG